LPVHDIQKKSQVFWVGLSSVQFSEGEEKKPLSPLTRTGGLISEIEKPFLSEISFYKTNVVKCLPIDENKIRYPFKYEMEKCYPNLEEEIETLNPTLVFLLGMQVSTFILKKHNISGVMLDEDFNYNSFKQNSIIFIPIHHPSYILVYKRKFINNYVNGIQQFFESILSYNSVYAG